jgi:hypothetical protein
MITKETKVPEFTERDGSYFIEHAELVRVKITPTHAVFDVEVLWVKNQLIDIDDVSFSYYQPVETYWDISVWTNNRLRKFILEVSSIKLPGTLSEPLSEWQGDFDARLDERPSKL